MTGFNGLGMSLGNLTRLSDAKTRSISAENFRGEKGKGGMSTDVLCADRARDLGQGWKVSPYVEMDAGETFTFAEIDGPGAIQSMWLSGSVAKSGPDARYYILRQSRPRRRRLYHPQRSRHPPYPDLPKSFATVLLPERHYKFSHM